MKTAVLLSIREKSTRFPGKVLKEFHGQTVTEHLIDRLKLASRPDTIVIATSVDPRDDVFVPMAKRKGIEIFRGSKEDKLKRYLDAVEHFGLDGAIIVDGDDILCFPDFIDMVVERMSSADCDVVFCKDLPLGAASSGLTKYALEKVMEIKDEEDTEVWGGYFTKRDDLFRVVYIEPEDELFRHPEIRLTMDYIEDFNLLKAIFDELYPSNPQFSSRDVMDLLVNRKPKLTQINLEAQKRYMENIARATPVRFKE